MGVGIAWVAWLTAASTMRVADFLIADLRYLRRVHLSRQLLSVQQSLSATSLPLEMLCVTRSSLQGSSAWDFLGAAMDEHRAAPRRRLLKAGTIEFGGGGIDCIVRNISETGAALEVVTPLFIPDRFTLFVPSDQFKRPCHMIWHKEKRIGVAFD